MEETSNKKIGVIISILGAVLTIVTMFLPFAKTRRESKSLVELAKLYFESADKMWSDKDRAMFYKIFVPLMVILIVVFALMYLYKCIKMKIKGMIVSTLISMISYELLKWDFGDRRVVPGACDQGIAFIVIYFAFALMIIGIVLRLFEKKREKQ